MLEYETQKTVSNTRNHTITASAKQNLYRKLSIASEL